MIRESRNDTNNMALVSETHQFYEEALLGRPRSLVRPKTMSHSPEFDGVFYVDPELTSMRLVDIFHRSGQVVAGIDEDLDAIVRDQVTRPEGGYWLHFHDGLDPDTSLLGDTAAALLGLNYNCMTLRERLIFERWCWWKYKNFPDTRTTTICAGSVFYKPGILSIDQHVPIVSRDSSKKLCIGKIGCRGTADNFGARKVLVV